MLQEQMLYILLGTFIFMTMFTLAVILDPLRFFTIKIYYLENKEKEDTRKLTVHVY